MIQQTCSILLLRHLAWAKLLQRHLAWAILSDAFRVLPFREKERETMNGTITEQEHKEERRIRKGWERVVAEVWLRRSSMTRRSLVQWFNKGCKQGATARESSQVSLDTTSPEQDGHDNSSSLRGSGDQVLRQECGLCSQDSYNIPQYSYLKTEESLTPFAYTTLHPNYISDVWRLNSVSTCNISRGSDS